ncbi:MAG: YCF48-related protein [Terriglobales bacterium]
MNELPKIVRARLNAAPAGDHPDPDQLTAFAEQALSDRERSTVLAHLSRCTDCRDVLALAVPRTGSAPASLDTADRAPWFRWTVLRWGAVAACLVIVGSAVLMKRDFMMTRSAKTATIQGDAQSAQLADERLVEPPLAGSQSRPQASITVATEPSNEKLAAPAQANTLKQISPPKQPMAAPAPTVLEKKIAGGIGGGPVQRAAVGALAAGAARNWQTTPTAPPKEDAKNPAVESRQVANLSIVPQTSETVEVQAAVPALETDAAAPADSRNKHEALGKAKPPSAAVMFERMDAPTPETVTASQGALSKEVATKANRERASSPHAPVSRWTISSDGQLQHSIDSGKTWQPVTVAYGATFRALSANGPDLWVGGASGLLYHSTDSGSHWIQVTPAIAGSSLTADIAAIEFTDARQGKITTTNGEVWLTDDAGQTWRKQP